MIILFCFCLFNYLPVVKIFIKNENSVLFIKKPIFLLFLTLFLLDISVGWCHLAHLLFFLFLSTYAKKCCCSEVFSRLYRNLEKLKHLESFDYREILLYQSDLWAQMEQEEIRGQSRKVQFCGFYTLYHLNFCFFFQIFQ